MAKRKTHRASFKAKVALEAIQGDLTIAELAAMIFPRFFGHTVKQRWTPKIGQLC